MSTTSTLKACYLCGNPGSKPLDLKSTFTGHSLAKNPTSNLMCDRCHETISGEYRLLWYWNEGKNKWSKVWGRSLSRLYQGDRLVFPTIEGTYTEGKDTLPVVKNLLTRQQFRDILLAPPEPPFTLVISESGQKHILPWAKAAYSQNYFPVQFEMDTVYVGAEFATGLVKYEGLLAMGFGKGEIDSGNYRSDLLLSAIKNNPEDYWEKELFIQQIRGTRLLELISYVAIKPG